MKKIGIILILILALTVGALSVFWSSKTFVKTDYNKLKLDGNESLMIVAHPDDEILWGGTKLINEDFVVVCITCGSDSRRVEEFKNVMNETDDKYIMLGYPDKVNGERSDWKDCYNDIEEDIKNIYGLQNWKEVVTHNPNGEYGHQHHKMTNAIVTDKVENKDKLIYFGKYYSKKKLDALESKPESISAELLNEKNEILTLYKTQENTIKGLSHMNPYEKYITYSEWQEMENSEEN